MTGLFQGYQRFPVETLISLILLICAYCCQHLAEQILQILHFIWDDSVITGTSSLPPFNFIWQIIMFNQKAVYPRIIKITLHEMFSQEQRGKYAVSKGDPTCR